MQPYILAPVDVDLLNRQQHALIRAQTRTNSGPGSNRELLSGLENLISEILTGFDTNQEVLLIATTPELADNKEA